jgi:hypothetical protein
MFSLISSGIESRSIHLPEKVEEEELLRVIG